MLKNYIKLAFRNFVKDKVFAVINLSNLVIGFATFILFSLYINYEFNWDRQNENYDRIYRVQLRIEQGDETELRTYTPPGIYFHNLDSIVGIDEKVLLREAGGVYMGVRQGDWIYDKTGYITTPSIFNVFTYHFIQGKMTTALQEPNSIVISEKMAEKLFPDGNALGKIIIGEKIFHLKVTGVYRDLPENSILKPNFLVSFATVEHDPDLKNIRDNFMMITYDTFVLLHPGTDPQAVTARLRNTFEGLPDRDKYYPYLRPLSKLYTAPNNNDLLVGLSVLSFGALLVLILSCVNYINLITANMSIRAKEIGIKKVAGSTRYALIVQFLTETVLLTLVAVILAVLVAQSAIPVLREVIGRPLEIDLFGNGRLLVILFFTSILIGLLSGVYPALVMSSIKPAKILKGKLFNNIKGSIGLKNTLMIAQFSISLYTILSSLIIYSQIELMIYKDLGFNDKHLLYGYIKGGDHVNYDAVRSRLLKDPDIINVSFSRTIPFSGNIGGYFGWEDSQSEERVLTSRNYVTDDFFDTYGIRLLQGRNFTPGSARDEYPVIINETALKTFGWKDPIGKNVIYFEKPHQVIGVVNDFHAYSIHQPIPVYIFIPSLDTINGDGYYTVRYSPGSINRVKKYLQEEMGVFYPESAFEFNDLESTIQQDRALRTYRSFGRISMSYTILTIMIAAIGLFGLILFSVKRRTKEIGIRKVMGSSVLSIFRLLTMEVLKLIGVAIIIVVPLAWYEHDLLPTYYKAPLTIWEFIAAVSALTLVSLLTISWHLFQAARVNPVEALHYE